MFCSKLHINKIKKNKIKKKTIQKQPIKTVVTRKHWRGMTHITFLEFYTRVDGPRTLQHVVENVFSTCPDSKFYMIVHSDILITEGSIIDTLYSVDISSKLSCVGLRHNYFFFVLYTL